MLGEPFDPEAEISINERRRPHWSQNGVIVFVTFRTQDSIPQEVITRWDREKNDWMERRGLPRQHWSLLLPSLSAKDRGTFYREFNRSREDYLDLGRGRCLLSQPEIASVISDALLHFDGDRYRMGDFIVMPNHVHLLATFAQRDQMRKQFGSWLHYTAVQINRRIGSRGTFWQKEPFDHLVRSSEQYTYLRNYIADNPQKAKLQAGQYHYRRYEP
jgi:putative transposase